MPVRKTKIAKHDERNIIAALDIGTHKTSCLIAKPVGEERLQIIGHALHASKGMKNGMIVDMQDVADTVARTVQSAEMMARQQGLIHPLQKVIVNISSATTFCYGCKSEIHLRGQAIQDHHVQKAMEHCLPENMPKNVTPLHQIPFGFVLDETQDVQNPIGMTANLLRARLLEIAVPQLLTDNVGHAVNHAHLDVQSFCLSAYASGLSCLVEDERDLGCTLIDMGAGMTHIAVFAEGRLVYAAGIPVGSSHVTNDIARGLTTTLKHAERIKTLYGHALPAAADDNEMIDINHVGEDGAESKAVIARSLLIGIIQPRLQEIFEMVRAQIEDSGLGRSAGRRVVLTGGGSMMPGIRDLAQMILDKQVRLGKPTERIVNLGDENNRPEAATLVGLLKYGFEHENEIPVRPSHYSARNFWGQMIHWVRENW